jgi:RimJ/RimL family protein N-acetyltransferase
MIGEAIELLPFTRDDFDPLIAQVPDARFLLQWSGPEWIFPLDVSQLDETLGKAKGHSPSFKVFKAVLPPSPVAVGHVQLMHIDYESETCVLGRVLIFCEHRGKGLGAPLVMAALDEAFVHLGLREVSLKVFAFNKPAVHTYETVGFVTSGCDVEPSEIDRETWEVLSMKLGRERWAESRRHRPTPEHRGASSNP